MGWCSKGDKENLQNFFDFFKRKKRSRKLKYRIKK